MDVRIVELYNENRTILENKGRAAQIDKKKKLTWETMTTQINSEFGTSFDKKKLEEKWRYLKRTSKAANASHIRQTHGTGGGPPPTPLTEVNEKVVEVLGETASFQGIPGAIESSAGLTVISSEPTSSLPPAASLQADRENIKKKSTKDQQKPGTVKYEDILQLQATVLRRDFELQTVKFRLFGKIERYVDLKLSEMDNTLNDVEL